MLLTLLFLALILYGVLLALLWGWSVFHAYTTPKSAFSRRGLWTLALIVNPISCMWYWYVWKRWAFWALFAPAVVFLTFLPHALESAVKTFAIREIGDRFVSIATAILNNVIGAIPLPILIPLIVFPFILRLAALAHLGGNTDLEAADRNDHAIAFSLPLVGLGAAMLYCFKWRRAWALAGLGWFLLEGGVVWSFIRYI
jgi:hypothetical protein